MKKLLCIILILTILVSIFSTSATAIIAPEDSAPLNQKEIIKQRFIELYGEDGILEDGVNYTWDFNQVEETENSSNVVSPNWSSSETPNTRVTHYEIIDMANEELKADDQTSIPAKYLTLVKKICRLCDTVKTDAPDAAKYISGHLHAEGNYVASLKYLNTLAEEVSKFSDSIEDTDKFFLDATGTARKTLPASIYENESFQLFIKLSRYIIKHYYNKENYAPATNQTSAGRCRYIVFGMITHLLGDLYAHRIIVPKKAVSSLTDTSPATALRGDPEIFVRSDFVAAENKFDWKTMRDIIKAGPTTNEEGKEIAVAFSELKNYSTIDKTSMLNKYYVDNGNFYPKRIREAVLAIYIFINDYKYGIYISNVIEPTYSFKLRNYSKYMNKAGDYDY